ncbi:hypothetical protein [Methylobacterium durans]|uniref:Uncharacterized protein n=1 Tax=Methylobacterium durans TaxID=2202825 RepID=A0A2U8WAV5_9HYPH|nr:hypothetical protein [Methylobacterium durans]AWN42570.1 hypothetical protein DK389_21265 [Methylobacterium durans]
MRRHLAGLMAAAIALAPAAASAQYYEYGPGVRRPHEHVDVYRHGDHDDVVVRRHHGHHDEYDRPAAFERRGHHHHHDFDD